MFGQTKERKTSTIRDSIYSVMKLSEEKKTAMNNLFSSHSKAMKALKKDESLSAEQKEEKASLLKREQKENMSRILSAEELKHWGELNAEIARKKRGSH